MLIQTCPTPVYTDEEINLRIQTWSDSRLVPPPSVDILVGLLAAEMGVVDIQSFYPLGFCVCHFSFKLLVLFLQQAYFSLK